MQFKLKKNKKKYVLDNKFIIQNQISEGGFSNVFEIKLNNKKRKQSDNESKNDLLCIKVFHSGQTLDELRKIEKEVEKEVMLSKLCNHQHIIKIFNQGSFKANDFFRYLIMEKHTCDLFDFLHEHDAKYANFKMDVKNTLILGQQIGSALQTLHEHHFIHLDIKPENILFNTQTKTWILCDLSSCIQYNDQNSLLNLDPAVTMLFAAPELIVDDCQSILCPKSDVYSLACCLYLCLFSMDYLPDQIIDSDEIIDILIYQQFQSKHHHHQLIYKNSQEYNDFGIALNNKQITMPFLKWYDLYKNQLDNNLIEFFRNSLECNVDFRIDIHQFLDEINEMLKNFQTNQISNNKSE